VRGIDELVDIGGQQHQAVHGLSRRADGRRRHAADRDGTHGGPAGWLDHGARENGSAIDVLVQRALRAGRTSPQWHGKTRPTILEAEAVHRAAVLAELVEAPTYFVHISCEEALAVVAAAKAKGPLPIHAETCPHYLTLDDSVYDGDPFDVAKYVMTPTAARTHHQGRLCMASARRRRCGVHRPLPVLHARAEDAGRDNFLENPQRCGRCRVPALLLSTGVCRRAGSRLEQLVAITATNPAQALRALPTQGSLMVGADADLVIPIPVGKTRLSCRRHRRRWTTASIEDGPSPAAIRRVLSRGTVVAADGVVEDLRGHGRFRRKGPDAEQATGRDAW